MLSRQKSVPVEERQRVQAEAATAQAAAEEARFDLARKLTEARCSLSEPSSPGGSISSL